MAERKLKVLIAGQEVTCNFGINYFYKHFNELTGIDMLGNGIEDVTPGKMLDLIPAIYAAGYLAECSAKKVDPALTKGDFDHHVMSMDEAGAAKMTNDYLDVIKTVDSSKPGEGEAQTKSP